MQPAMPDVPSEPLKETPNVWLYQPFESGARAGTAVTPAGAVASYLSPNEAAPPTLPALSVQLPVTDAPAVPGLEYVSAEGQRPMPAAPSVPQQGTDTPRRYEPGPSADR